MSWLTRLLGLERRGAEFPVSISLIPDKLGAHVYLHDVAANDGPVSCWSYVTHGLMRHRQPEVILTLRRPPRVPVRAYPPDPLRFFVAIDELAAQGRVVGAGSLTQFGDRSLFGRHLVYVRAERLAGVAVPDSAIAAILVTEEEVLSARRFGVTRLVSRLGFAARYYPCLPWSDLSRPGLSLKRTSEESVLAGVPCAHASGLSIVCGERHVTIRLMRLVAQSLEKLFSEVPLDSAIALLADLDAGADGCMVWEPGQSEPAAIVPPGSTGSRLSACFALFVPQQPENRVHRVEDGLSVLLTDDMWLQVRRALTCGETLTLDVGEDGPLVSIEPVSAPGA